MYIPKWMLLIPVVVAAVISWKEYPAVVRYLKIARM